MTDKVLVTGGAGFIGSHVAEALVKMGKTVLVLDDLSGGFEDNLCDGVEFVRGSILDTALLERLFGENRITHIYHLAAYAAEGLSHFIRRFNYATNLGGSINLINLAVKHEVQCFVFTSSIAVYGMGQLPFTEDTVPRPEDPYGISKYSVELDLRAAHEMFGLNSVVFRPHNVYGERQNTGDPYRNVIGIFMNRILEGKPMPVFGDGNQTRAFSYISDVAPPIAHSGFMPEAYNHVYSIGADTPCSVRDLAFEVARVMGVKPEIAFLPGRREVVDAYSDHEKCQKMFGHLTEQVSLGEGLERMARWVRKVGSRQGSVFWDIEVAKNLPVSWQALGSQERKQ